MTEEDPQESAPAAQPVDPAAISLALGAAANNKRVAAKAEAFLEEQTRLARDQTLLVQLQAAELRHEDTLRHWSSRVRHVSDLLKLAFELAAAMIATAIAIFIGGAVWAAAHDHALVIEAFNVPSDMAARGLTGQVLATQLQDRLARMQSQTDTIRQASTFRNNWGNDIKVQIPDTGVSVGELYGYLAGWLGDETHITGEVWRSGNGVSLAIHSGSDSGQTFTGRELDLGRLVGQAAEDIYRETQPYRYAIFLDEHNRRAESLSAVRALALNGAAEDRPWALSRWGFDLMASGDPRGALQKNEIAIGLNPNLPHIWGNLAASEAYFGHDEAVLRDFRRSVALLQRPDTARVLASYAVAADVVGDHAILAEALGDYREAIATEEQLAKLPSYSESGASPPVMMSADLAWNHDVAASRHWDSGKVSGELTYLLVFARTNGTAVVPPLPAFARAASMEDWPRARDDLAAFVLLREANAPAVATILPVAVWPWLAYAHARVGEFVDANALIDKTPLDCYLCLRMRGDIDAAEKNWDSAARWFAGAVKQGPSLPFAEADWGEMLLRKGDVDGAIAKFEQAHAKGPHFADPLEMWGEALIAKSRSDLALGKFEEADKFAPNWGRLHLKWAEALYWAGDKTAARKQFTIASTLDLSSYDKVALANWAKRHG